MLAVKKTITNTLTTFRRSVKLMGDSFEISVVGKDAALADEQIDAAVNEINRVEKLLSTFSDDSIINQVNRNAGIQPVKVNPEIFGLIDRSLKIAELTYGAFDISYYSADKNSNAFESANNSNTLTVSYSVNYASYKNVVMDAKATTVFLKDQDMRIGFGANRKGYAIDRAKYIMQMNGVSSGVINAGGDLLTWGFQPDFEPWTVAAADPSQSDKPYANVNISDMAVATSANTEKYASINTKSTSFKPKNGFVVSSIKSVSIISPRAEFADAMASPVMTIGINGGLYLINQLNQVGCVIIDDHNRVYSSKDIQIAD